MKNLLRTALLTLLIAGTSASYAQDDKSKRKSPPAELRGKVGNVELVVNYSQPSVKGRVVWGELVPYGKVWRTGANEATTIEITEDIKIEGKVLKAGKYSVFTIPEKGEWTIVFNSVWEQWGAYKYESDKDVLRVKVKPTEGEMTEQMVFTLEGKGGKAVLALHWDKLVVPIRVGE